MDDLIYRDYLIGKFEYTGQPAVSEMGKGYDLGIAAALRVVKNAPSVNRWVACREMLPEKDKSYITYAETTKYCNHNEIPEESRINILYFNGEEWYSDECIYYNVTHWMPLPESPRKE
jgi:hypothetical protein